MTDLKLYVAVACACDYYVTTYRVIAAHTREEAAVLATSAVKPTCLNRDGVALEGCGSLEGDPIPLPQAPGIVCEV